MYRNVLVPNGAQGRLRAEFNRGNLFVPVEGKGAWIKDREGRRYLDIHMAFGAILLGHSDEDVAEAVSEQSRRLLLHGAGITEEEMEYASLISSLIPSAESVIFTNSGSEAVLLAIRAARSYTGRELIVKFEGNYHGWHDYSMFNVKTSLSEGKQEETLGIPESVKETVEVLPYNDVEAFREFMEERGEEVAGVILEPVAHSMGAVPATREFLKTLREYTSTYGSLLIFDEIVTAVRHSINGYQSLVGVIPDLTTLGKGIGNGLPVAALVGKREYMGVFEQGAVSSGTYSGNPLVTRGGRVALEKAVRKRVDLYVTEYAEDMANAFSDIFEDAHIDTTVVNVGGIVAVYFGVCTPPANLSEVRKADRKMYTRFSDELRKEGVLLSPNFMKRMHFSLSHGEGEGEFLIEVVERVARRL